MIFQKLSKNLMKTHIQKMQNSMMFLKWDSNNNKWFCQLKTRWNCDKLWKNKFCFCWFSSKPKVKFQMKKLKQQMNFIDMMIVLEKIPKKLLYLNKKEVVQNCQKFSCEFHQYLLVQFHLKILISFSLTFLKIFFNSNDFISFLLFFSHFFIDFREFSSKIYHLNIIIAKILNSEKLL